MGIKVTKYSSNKKFGLWVIGALSMASPALAAVAPLACLIEPDQIANVGSQIIGVTDTIMVERGDYVHKGQVLATLKSDIERANVEVAKTRSQLEADIRSAEANLRLAKITEERGQVLVQKNFISQQALDKSHAETQLAQQKVVFAREQLRVASGELGVARAQLGMRAIRSPIDGIIADRFIWPGERVEEKPLFRIVKTNPLRVEVVVPVAFYGKIEKNQMISVLPDLPNATAIEAKITLVDKLIDGASNTFRVRAEIPNPDLAIPSGLRCKANFTEQIKSTQLHSDTPAEYAGIASVNLNTEDSQSKSSKTMSPKRIEPSKSTVTVAGVTRDMSQYVVQQDVNKQLAALPSKSQVSKSQISKSSKQPTESILAKAELNAKKTNHQPKFEMARAGGYMAHGVIRKVSMQNKGVVNQVNLLDITVNKASFSQTQHTSFKHQNNMSQLKITKTSEVSGLLIDKKIGSHWKLEERTSYQDIPKNGSYY